MTVDPRFYAPQGALTLGKIAELTGATLEGDPSVEITGVSAAATGRRGDLAFLDGDGKGEVSVGPDVSALILNEANRKHAPEGVPCLVTSLPRHAHGLVAYALFQPRHLVWSGEDRISPHAKVHPGAIVSPGAVVGPGATVGEGTVIGANAVVGPGVGEAGFGVTGGPAGMEDAPHFGRVILQDNVTIGANSCIDRGVFDDTIIGERTKIDNLCQIAHNVVFGRSVVMAAFGGISGSVTVGDGVNLAASAGVFRNIEAGETWGGTPAKPIRQWMREVAWLQKQANPKKTS